MLCTYFILLYLIIGVRNYSENEQISVKMKRSFNSINRNVLPTIGQTSLAIIFDCTSSMSDDLKEMIQGAERLIDEISKRPDNPIYNYIFVCFRDPDIESAIVTTKKQVLLDILNDVKLEGNYDCPAMTLGGILEGLKYVMDKSYVYIFTDDTSKDFHKADEVLDIIQKKQATVSFFVTDGCESTENVDFSLLKKLAVFSNGEFYDLNTTDIGEVMDDFRDTVDTRLTTLKYLYEPAGKNNTIELTVDSNLEQIFVSVAGTRSFIEITDSHNQQINATNILKLDNLNKVKIDHPNSGQWSILVGANSPHTIKISGTSNISFTFGFSLELPDKIENTVRNPIIGVENILVISPSDPNLITNLTAVNITSSNESLTLILKLYNDEISETILYATEPFTIPFAVFKIHIFGFDQHENGLERLISTSIEAKEKSPPFIEIEIKKLIVKEGDDFSIKCHVRSVLPITVKWMKNNEELEVAEFNQSESLEYTIEKAEEINAGEYVCSAVNEKGTSDDFVQVSIEPSLLFVKIPELEYSKPENDFIEIPCIVKSSRNYSLTWTHNNEQIQYENEYELLGDNLLIKNLSRNHEGILICEVMGKDNFLPESASTFLHIELLNKTDETDVDVGGETGKPSLKAERITKGVGRTESDQLEIKRFDPLNLICPFENYDTILWYKNGDLIEKRETEDCISYENDTLHFNHTRYSDRGEYKCTAENKFGRSYYTYRINIVWPPKISIFPSYDNISGANLIGANKVQLNQEVKLNCVVNHNPKSEIMWVKPDDSIVHGNHLHIEKVTVNDQGIYRCLARNDYGHDEKSYELEIIKLRPKKKQGVETKKFILEGSVLLLDCQIDGYPVVTYTWFYNGEIVSSNSQYLRKNSVKLEDRGWYQCLASNAIGSEVNTFSVQVYNIPKITYINASTTINDFDEFNLECKAKGFPLPFISWKLNYEELLIPPNDIYQKYQSGQVGQYYIPTMHGSGVLMLDRNNEISLKIIFSKNTRKQAGKYICRAENFRASDEKFVEVKVHSNPLVRPDNIYEAQHINVTEGMRLTLQCPTQRNPTLYFLWRKNKKNIDKSDKHIYFTNAGKHLKILRAHFEDAGIYECLSSTQKFVYNVSVLVEQPPSFKNPENEFFSTGLGANVNLNCSSTGNPTITWFKGDDLIEVLPNYENYKFLDNKQILKILLNDSASFGGYSCKAENHHDTIEKHFEVNHYEKITLSDWSPCSSTCGKGEQSRQRKCSKSDVHCQPKIEVRECEFGPCDDYYTASGDSSDDFYSYKEYDEIDNFCGKGYEFKNNKCQDINECHSLRSNCDDYKHTCLNKNGSYECLPTPCKPQHSIRKTEKHYPNEVTKDCIKNCFNSNSKCATKAIMAETIQYSVLSLSKIPKLHEPIKKFVNYNVHWRPLEHTEFRLIRNTSNAFYLKNKSNSKAISYLYTRQILQKEQLYILELIARSFHYEENESDAEEKELLYYTRYFIYIYIL